jgi:phosphohistidine phosphatase
MYLLLIRHAISEDRVEFARSGKSDHYRPLTRKGRRRMTLGAAGLRSIVPDIDVLASSPLSRAEQTAEIIAGEYDIPRFLRVEAIATGDGRALLDWLRQFGPDDVVAVVGHEPHLSEWSSWLLAGSMGDFMLVKKGSAILIEFPDEVRPGAAWLHWALTPRQLRQLGQAGHEEEEEE